MSDETIKQMAHLLYLRWSKLFAWGAMGMIEWTPEVQARFTVAYATYAAFCTRHGRPVAGYGVVDFGGLR
jgi:hypothetical protein